MKDKDFDALKLRMSIVPNQTRWPEPKYTHWEKLHDAADEARTRVSKAFAAMAEVDEDPNLTAEGKANQRAKLAEKALADLKKSNTLEQARAAVARQQEAWAKKFGIDQVIKPAEDHGTATTHAQIREHVSELKDGMARLSFLEKHADDPTVVSAVLSAPGFLSGLTDSELAVIRQRVERRVTPAEVIEAMTKTKDALADAEHGWRRAGEVIAQRGGLPKLAKEAA